MDGIIGDHVANGRLLRLATLTYALDNFPRLIYRIKQKRIEILSSTIINGKKTFRLRDKINKYEMWIILETDYLLCRNIAAEFELKVFPSDTQKSMEEKIRALVRVTFSDRPF